MLCVMSVPPADLHIHDHQLVRTTKTDGIPIRDDVLFTNDKGEENGRIQKRTEKTLQKLLPALQRLLLPDEAVLYVMPARSPLSILEQLTAAWWTSILAASTIVLTNKRILFCPVKRDGSWRESVRAVPWGDLEEVKANGLLIRNLSFKFKNGSKITYTNIRRPDAKKIAAIADRLIPAGSGEVSSTQGLIQLCPDCRDVLTGGNISAPDVA
jgi:hypothetical protein